MGYGEVMESEQKRGIRSLAAGNGNSVLRLHRLTEELGKIEKGIKAESMEKVREQKHKRRGRANKDGHCRRGLMWKRFTV